MNKVILLGRLTKDPTLRSTQSGKNVSNFTLAINEKYKETENVIFQPIVAWGKIGELAHQYLAKGRQCMVVGKLQHRKYTNNEGSEASVVEVVASEIEFVGDKQGAPKKEVENPGNVKDSHSQFGGTDFNAKPIAPDMGYDLPF